MQRLQEAVEQEEGPEEPGEGGTGKDGQGQAAEGQENQGEKGKEGDEQGKQQEGKQKARKSANNNDAHGEEEEEDYEDELTMKDPTDEARMKARAERFGVEYEPPSEQMRKLREREKRFFGKAESEQAPERAKRFGDDTSSEVDTSALSAVPGMRRKADEVALENRKRQRLERFGLS